MTTAHRRLAEEHHMSDTAQDRSQEADTQTWLDRYERQTGTKALDTLPPEGQTFEQFREWKRERTER